MYTHIGDGVIIKSKDIIGIFDMKAIETSRENRKIQFEIKEKKAEGKSVILMEQGERYENIFSPISVATLKKRIEKGLFQTKER